MVQFLTGCMNLMVMTPFNFDMTVQVPITVAVLLLWALKNKLSLVN